MSTPAAKRRRIDAATHTLSKPFRSPFKTPFKSPVKNTAEEEDISEAEKAAVLAPKSSNSLLPNHVDPAAQGSVSTRTPLRTLRTKKSFSSLVAAAALNADPDIAPLLRAQRELEKQLREVKEELDAAEQARKIENESRKRNPKGEVDAELVELIEKWKDASRQAAEELFGKVLEKVNRMGGPRAWKEAQKRQQDFQNSWDQEEQQNNDSDDSDGEKKGVEKRDVYAEYDIDPESELEKSQRPKGLGDNGELPGQEDEFTIAMMLRAVNIDLDIIGYDREGQRWID